MNPAVTPGGRLPPLSFIPALQGDDGRAVLTLAARPRAEGTGGRQGPLLGDSCRPFPAPPWPAPAPGFADPHGAPSVVLKTLPFPTPDFPGVSALVSYVTFLGSDARCLARR